MLRHIKNKHLNQFVVMYISKETDTVMNGAVELSVPLT